jgi:hypothetical protein
MTAFRRKLSHLTDVALPVVAGTCTTLRLSRAPTLKIEVLAAKVGQQRNQN